MQLSEMHGAGKVNNNYKLLIIFQWVNVYLNKPIIIDELIKVAIQSVQ